jgi:hypothetical protein
VNTNAYYFVEVGAVRGNAAKKSVPFAELNASLKGQMQVCIGERKLQK